MEHILQPVCLWAHLLCMVGALGAVAAFQLALPARVREDADVARRSYALLNILVAVGLVAGLAAYYLKIRIAGAAGEELAGAVHMKVGIKFILFVCVAACFGVGSAKAKRGQFAAAHGLRWASILLLAGAALVGVFI